MKYITLLITVSLLAIVLLASCATSKPLRNNGCGDENYKHKFRAELILQEGGSISNDHVKTMLLSVHRTMMGFKHSFLTDTKDTIVIKLNYRFEPGRIYWLHKDYLKISS